MATSGDILLATREDSYMATDTKLYEVPFRQTAPEPVSSSRRTAAPTAVQGLLASVATGIRAAGPDRYPAVAVDRSPHDRLADRRQARRPLREPPVHGRGPRPPRGRARMGRSRS